MMSLKKIYKFDQDMLIVIKVRFQPKYTQDILKTSQNLVINPEDF